MKSTARSGKIGPGGLQASRRLMMARDLDAVLAIEVRAYSHPWTRGNFMDSLASGYHVELLHVLDRGEVELAGYFVLMFGVDELHLLNITVAPEWQGQGLGWGLLDAVSTLALDRGLARVLLEVRAGNRRAQGLYSRYGFEAIGMRRGYYPAALGREDAVVMRLALAARSR
jgi:ribosomal-protein-alanine N-acetyltransferase